MKFQDCENLSKKVPFFFNLSFIGTRTIVVAALLFFGFCSDSVKFKFSENDFVCGNSKKLTSIRMAADGLCTSVATTYTVTPANNSLISATQQIKVVFSATMNTGSLSLSGSMAADANTGVWSTTSLENDTLTISPQSSWSSGTKLISISVEDIAGGKFPAIELTLSRLNGIIYVKTTGNDGNDGSETLPMLTINAAVIKANSTFGISEVRVAAGTYAVDHDSLTHVTMIQGVSVIGGYSASDWNVHDPATYVTTIQDTASGGVGDLTTGHRAVEFPSSINNTSIDTILTGFTIEGGTGDFSSAVYIDGAKYTATEGGAQIKDCIIEAGNATTIAAGVSGFNGSTVLIQDNKVRNRNGFSNATSTAIYSENSALTILNNFINSKVNTSTGTITNGIYIKSSGPAEETQIMHNTIYGGNSSTSNAVVIENNTKTNLVNNIVFGNNLANSICVSIVGGASFYLNSFKNNVLYDCNKLYNDNSGSKVLTNSITVAGSTVTFGSVDVPAYDSGVSFFNLSTDDWRLASSSDLNIRKGGASHLVSLSSLLGKDYFGSSRTSGCGAETCPTFGTGYSLGAHETDTVGTDSTPPVVNITSPTNGSNVKSDVVITASATDNDSVSKVEFYIDGSLVKTDTSSPYTYSWPTVDYTNHQSYALKAIAYDASNNTATDDDTSVTTTNAQIYWADGGDDNIYRVMIEDSAQVETFASSLNLTHADLEIDVDQQKLFWIEDDSKTLKVKNLDGTGEATLQNFGPTPLGLAIDRDMQLLYVNLGTSIDKYDYSGTSPGSFPTTGFTTQPAGDLIVDTANMKLVAVDTSDQFIKFGTDGSAYGAVVTSGIGYLADYVLEYDSASNKILYFGNSNVIEFFDYFGTETVSSSSTLVGGVTGMAINPDTSELYFLERTGNKIYGPTSTTNPAVTPVFKSGIPSSGTGLAIYPGQ
jgi:hypothetical protein